MMIAEDAALKETRQGLLRDLSKSLTFRQKKLPPKLVERQEQSSWQPKLVVEQL